MIELFQEKDPVKYLHPIITCHVKMEEFGRDLEVEAVGQSKPGS
jgi:hypothetical protein